MCYEADVLLFLEFIEIETKQFSEGHWGGFVSDTTKGFLTVGALKHCYEL